MDDKKTMRNMSTKIRRHSERGFEDFGWCDNYMTFSFANYFNPEFNNFGPLRVMIENHIQPHSGFPPHPHRDVEIVTYISSGTLTHKDNFGHTAEIKSGEMQLISAGSKGMIHSEENLHDEIEHNYQMWLIPEKPGTPFSYNQLGFTKAERSGQLKLYVSRDGREGSMKINTDADIYSGLFNSGQSVKYHLKDGRGIWLQIVQGSFRLNNKIDFNKGDGVGITNAGLLELTFLADSEILAFDVNMNSPLIWK